MAVAGCLDNRHVNPFVGLVAGDFFQFDRYLLRALGRLEQLDGDPLPALERLDRPLTHVGVEHVDHLLIGGHVDGQLAQLGAANRVVQRGPGPHDARRDPHLLLGLYAGQGRHAGGPLGLGRPVDAHGRSGPDEGQHHGLLRPLPGGRLRGRDQRVQVHFHSRLRNRHPPPADRRLRRLERNTVSAGCPYNRLGILQLQFELLGLLAFLLDQQAIILARPTDDARGFAPQRGTGDSSVGQPQRNLVPPLGQHLDLQLGLNPHHVLFDRGLVVDLSHQSADRRFWKSLGARPGFILGRLP